MHQCAQMWKETKWSLLQKRENPLDVGNVYWYQCRQGGFEMKDGTLVVFEFLKQ